MERDAIEWLLAGDPAIRWQTMRDLLDEPEAVWRAERSRVEANGWGKQLLSHQDADGQWAGDSFAPRGFTEAEWEREGQPWTSSHWVLSQLRELGLDPRSECARRTVELLGRNSRWDEAGQPFWEGETDACINARVVADGSYFGVDVRGIVDRLLTERQEDGGWNCFRLQGSTRSSFLTTVNVLEGLLAYEQANGRDETVQEARRSGEEYLLSRHLFRRLSTGDTCMPQFLQLHHPNHARYDVLRAFDYFRAAAAFDGTAPDGRLAEAVELVRSKRNANGRWSQERDIPGRVWFRMEGGKGSESRWLTLRALRVLRWIDPEASKL